MLIFVVLNSCRYSEECEDKGFFDTEEIIDVSIVLDDEDWSDLRNQSRTFLREFLGDCMAQPFEGPYTYFSANISINGDSQENIGVRKKGFIGSQSTVKPSLKINIDEYEQGIEVGCVDNITLNNGVQDPSMIRQCLSYFLLEKAGVPSPKCNFARVQVNEASLGLYVHVEPIKRSFLRDHFGSDDGDLYEGTLSDFDVLRIETFEVKNDDTDQEKTTLRSLTDLLASPPVPLKESLEEYIDIDSFFTFWIMESLLGHWDGYSGNTNNFYIYRTSDTEKIHFIPWGMDDSFETEEGILTKTRLIQAILGDAELSNLFDQRLDELMEAVWNEEQIIEEINRMENLLSSDLTVEEQEEIELIRTYVRNRKSIIEASLPVELEEITPPYCLQEVGSIETSFEATWGSLERNVLEEGTTSSSLIWGQSVPIIDSGAIAGYDRDRGAVLLGLLLDPTEVSLLLPYVNFDVSSVEVGVEIPIDHISTYGSLLYTDESMNYELVEAAVIYNGSLIFDQFDPSQDGLVTGSIASPFFNWVAQ
jgi:hypothetical protein